MAKILLVEDDNNLREIYEARLQAEGYDIVSARDGEEALTVAMKERPDLIISDVMMPKISGFDMLDIIRSTEETRNVKVIMMTALSQAEDKDRATKLGADRYLVKSQVTLEDVAKVAREVLNGASDQDEPITPVIAPPAVMQAPTVETPVAPVQATPVPLVETPEPVVVPAPELAVVSAPVPLVDDSTVAPIPVTPALDTTDSPALAAISPTPVVDDSTVALATDTENSEESAIAAQIESFIEVKKTEPEAIVAEVPEAVIAPEPEIIPEPSEVNTDASEKTGKKVIQPLSDPTQSKGPDLENLLKKEAEKDQMAEIAKTFATQKADVADELTAEAALRSAARAPQSIAATEELNIDSPQVDITENGDLKVQSEPHESTVVEQVQPQIDTSNVPKVDASNPIIPHSNGSSLDGVVSHPVINPTPVIAEPMKTPIESSEPSKEDDPNAIAL